MTNEKRCMDCRSRSKTGWCAAKGKYVPKKGSIVSNKSAADDCDSFNKKDLGGNKK